MKRLAILLTLLLAPAAYGQSVLILDLGNNTQIAMVTLASGEVVVIPSVTVFKIPAPTPVSQVVSSVLVYESGDQTQEQNQVQIQIRMDLELSPKILILDKDTTLPDGEPIPKLQAAINLIGSKPLPQLVGFNGSGAAVVSESVPNDIAGVKSLLERWGL